MMDIKGKKIWQQAAGDTDRNYVDLCLKWDVILNGPGHKGRWPECKQALLNEGWTKRKMTILGRFCDEMKDGNIVVLRLGTSNVYGVGVIVGDYKHMEEFGDIDGWMIQHVRRVVWLWKPQDKPKRFKPYTLKQGDTTLKMDSELVISWLKSLEIPEEAYNRELVTIPKLDRENQLDNAEISEYLFDKGVANNSIESLIHEMDELKRIAKWYSTYRNPSEAETVTYLAIPLLRALGWTPQKMAIEWKKVDIALFKQLPRNDENLTVVVEAKKKDYSCLTALSQAKTYAEGRDNCRRLIVTDGIRYGIFVKVNSSFVLYAYMNLTNLREEYPIYECYGAKQALLAMTPEWNEKQIKLYKEKSL